MIRSELFCPSHASHSTCETGASRELSRVSQFAKCLSGLTKFDLSLVSLVFLKSLRVYKKEKTNTYYGVDGLSRELSCLTRSELEHA